MPFHNHASQISYRHAARCPAAGCGKAFVTEGGLDIHYIGAHYPHLNPFTKAAQIAEAKKVGRNGRYWGW